MIHLDLFSGIGGFAIAVDEVWDNVEHIFCDNDKFSQSVIKKHWPESEIYDDIRLITDTRRKHGSVGSAKSAHGQTTVGSAPTEDSERFGPVDILTGGFPCQPFSAAGLRRGTEDDRHLWPEMLRVIQLTKPTWVIAENVRGLLTLQGGVVFEQVCLDLEAAGYEVQPLIIPAVAVGAPHRRDRVWFIAHANGSESRRAEFGSFIEKVKKAGINGTQDDATGQSSRTDKRIPEDRVNGGHDESATNTNVGGIRRHEREGSEQGSTPRSSWKSDWLEIATRLCGVDDGLPAKVGGITITKSAHRKAQLKAYGNAIVPQVAIEIMKGMRSDILYP